MSIGLEVTPLRTALNALQASTGIQLAATVYPTALLVPQDSTRMLQQAPGALSASQVYTSKPSLAIGHPTAYNVPLASIQQLLEVDTNPTAYHAQ